MGARDDTYGFFIMLLILAMLVITLKKCIREKNKRLAHMMAVQQSQGKYIHLD